MQIYVATFFTHYGAMKFSFLCERAGVAAKQAPVPRALGSSCGTCVYFEAAAWDAVSELEDMEACFLCGDNDYIRVYTHPECFDE